MMRSKNVSHDEELKIYFGLECALTSSLTYRNGPGRPLAFLGV